MTTLNCHPQAESSTHAHTAAPEKCRHPGDAARRDQTLGNRRAEEQMADRSA
jgi:hypothetical protein